MMLAPSSRLLHVHVSITLHHNELCENVAPAKRAAGGREGGGSGRAGLSSERYGRMWEIRSAKEQMEAIICK